MFRRLLLLSGFVLFVACGDDATPTNPPDMGQDLTVDQPDDTPDAAQDAAQDMDEPTTLCSPCTVDEDCPEGTCFDLVAEGERVCGQNCIEGVADTCPVDFFCAELGADNFQCIPDGLTCVDRCGTVDCAGNEVCDPFTGMCRRPLRLCESGCVTSDICGDGPEDICISIPNTPDNERVCATGCNPEAETSECPADFSCLAVDSENDPTAGICFPIQGTCTDRCDSVDCPDGQNCDPVTGQCSVSEFGPCEPGCTNSTQCLGQNDLCLDLGIGDGAHCWEDCGDGTCTDGYECANLVGTSINICIPIGRDCSTCYQDSCFPTGICNPVDATCLPIEADCNAVGCPGGFVCNVATSVCQAIDQPCTGDSWAVDCDNVLTKCTTRRSGTQGVCAQNCLMDADCFSGTCVDTVNGRLCLPPDLGGASACGNVQEAGNDVGRPCQPGSCRTSASQCQTGGNIDGYCTRACTTDANCSSNERCGAGPMGGATVCIPVQCECSGYHGLTGASAAALDDALDASGLSSCTLVFEPRSYAQVGDISDLLWGFPGLDAATAYPLRTLGLRDDQVSLVGWTSVTQALERAATARGDVVQGNAATYNFPGAESKMTQAAAALITAAGGTPDITGLEAAALPVPAAAQDLVAPIVMAVVDAYTAREAALSAAGWTQADVAAAYAGAPYLFLPGTPAQLGAAPDLLDPAVRAKYASYPLRQMQAIAANLSATIEAQLAAAGDTSTLLNFSYVVDTPAGVIVIGDAGATVFNPSSNPVLSNPIAVLVDLGGSDTYRLANAANRDDAPISISVDLGGDDTYAYVALADPNDGILLTSDSDGRVAPSVPLNQGNGPVSASEQGRQASARLGIALLWDLGGGSDQYRALRMSQSSAVMGVSALWDDGGVDDFQAEAFAQGAALHGIAVLHNAGGQNDSYRVWHAGQGFAAGGGLAWLVDEGGNDSYLAVPGATGEVVYFSPTDRGVSNRNLAQAAAVGIAGASVGGMATLVDMAGTDTYTAGTYAQGYAAYRGMASLIDIAGDDTYEGRGVVQASAEWGSGALLWDADGSDDYNPTSPRRQLGQGVGQLASWGVLLDEGGDDTARYIAPAGGAAIDGGFGAAIFTTGVTSHDANSNATWGFSQNAPMMAPFDAMPTLGVFIDAGSTADTYLRPDLNGIGDGQIWRQPAGQTQTGYGTDR